MVCRPSVSNYLSSSPPRSVKPAAPRRLEIPPPATSKIDRLGPAGRISPPKRRSVSHFSSLYPVARSRHTGRLSVTNPNLKERIGDFAPIEGSRRSFGGKEPSDLRDRRCLYAGTIPLDLGHIAHTCHNSLCIWSGRDATCRFRDDSRLSCVGRFAARTLQRRL